MIDGIHGLAEALGWRKPKAGKGPGLMEALGWMKPKAGESPDFSHEWFLFSLKFP